MASKIPNSDRIKEMQIKVIPLRQDIPRKICELMNSDINMLKKAYQDIGINDNQNINVKEVTKSYFSSNLCDAPKVCNYSEQLINLNTKKDSLLKVMDYLKKQ